MFLIKDVKIFLSFAWGERLKVIKKDLKEAS